MKLKFFFILMLLVSSCNYENRSDLTLDPIEQANKARDNFVKKIKKKYNFKQLGIRDRVVKGIQVSGATFQCKDKLQKNEARSLIVRIIQEYLEEFNKNDQIHPLIKKFPFKLKNINIVIFLGGYNGERVYGPYIGVVSCSDGLIYYKTYDPDNRYTYKSVTSETFNEALSILKSQI